MACARINMYHVQLSFFKEGQNHHIDVAFGASSLQNFLLSSLRRLTVRTLSCPIRSCRCSIESSTIDGRLVALLSADDVCVALDNQPILHDLSFEIAPGTWVGLLGPNGSGKTTLLRAISGVLPYDGQLLLDGRPVQDWMPRSLAQRVAFVRQSPTLTFDFTVKDLVLLGRSPHKRWLQSYNSYDRQLAQEALAQVELEGFGERSVLSLSGGELQRVFLAQALVQEADFLLLDEPTAHLDVHYQFAFMDQVQELVDKGRTILSVFHDLELAARYAERLLVLNEGRLVADGAPPDVLTPDLIATVFRMTASVQRGVDGTLRIDYRGQRSEAPSPLSNVPN